MTIATSIIAMSFLLWWWQTIAPVKVYDRLNQFAWSAADQVIKNVFKIAGSPVQLNLHQDLMAPEKS